METPRPQKLNQQRNRQNGYLADFGITRRQVLGDGNCLFRSISFGLVGNEDQHKQLRQTAINHIRTHLPEFRMFFLPDNPSILDIDAHIAREIDHLSQDGSYAGQESVVALVQALGIDILVTYGGFTEQDSRVLTMQHFASPNAATKFQGTTVHIVFSDIGGGHYDAAQYRLDSVDAMEEILQPASSIKPPARQFAWKESAFSKFSVLQPRQSTVDKSNIITTDIKSNDNISKATDLNSKDNMQTPSSNTVRSKPSADKYCDKCGKKFGCTGSLKRHCSKFHPDMNIKVKERESATHCLVPKCSETFRTVKNLIIHLENFHHANIKTLHQTFKDMDEFSAWKESEEIANNIFFSKVRPETVGKKRTCLQFVCNRHGHKKKSTKATHGKNRKGNTKGTCKLGGLCPSRMYVSVDSDSTQVEYIQTHTHSVQFDQTKYLPIPQSVREDIGKKLSLGIPVDTILNDIRNNVGNLQNRGSDDIKFFQLINRKNIVEMKRKIVDCQFQKNSSDSTSTMLWVEQLRANTSKNPILVFKPQFVVDKSLPLPKDDFILVIMTNEQADMYKLFGGRILCMDSTHKTNMYDFKLITLLVVDDYHRGYPVAFCISNREDEITQTIFLRSVKERCPMTKIGVFLTDDDMAGINAAKNVFGNELQHYLCIWHVYQSWRRKIHSSVKDKDNKIEIFYFLHVMLNAKSEREFQDYLDKFTSKYSVIEPTFFNYFTKNYLSRTAKWALHLRQPALQTQINTNMHLESFHNKLKTIYFQRKQNKRMDKLISILLEMEKHFYLNRFRYTQYNTPSDFSACSYDRHASGLCIPDSYIKFVNETRHTVQSSKDSNTCYTISLLAVSCHSESCLKKCNSIPCIDLCSHLYSCSCPDTEPLCKHIHKLHSMNSMRNVGETDLETEIELICTQDPEPLSNKYLKEETLLASYRKLNDLLNKQVEDPEIRRLRLESIVSTLNNLVTTNKAAQSVAVTPCMKPKFKVASNQKFVKQPSFKKTQKTRPKPKNSLRAPSAADKEKLGQSEQTRIPVGPSVAPYPLVEVNRNPTRRMQTQQTDTPPSASAIVSNNAGISILPNFLVPPSVLNRPILIKLPNGREMTIVTSSGMQISQDKNDQ